MSFWCFVFFRCLIYKVQARPLSHTRRSFIITPRLPLVKPLFRFPQNFFCFQLPGSHPSPALANFVILPRSSPVVKNFFQFLEIFLTSWGKFPAPLGERSTIIANTPPVVNPLFQIFSTFSNSPACSFSFPPLAQPPRLCYPKTYHYKYGRDPPCCKSTI